MYQLILLLHVFAAVCIVSLVLVQQGKGATLGAAFGSGASSTVFGSRGSGSFLFRITVGFIVVFFITSISLNYLVMRAYKQDKTVTLPVVPVSQPQPAPVTPMPLTEPVNNLGTVPPANTVPGEIPTRK